MTRALAAIAALAMLAGCQTTTATTTRTICAPWRAITYSGTKDTSATTKQVRIYNATGRNLGCWQ